PRTRRQPSSKRDWSSGVCPSDRGRNPYGTGPLEAVLGRVAMGKFDLDGAPRNFVPLIGACLDPKPERRPSGQMILDALVDIESGRMPQLGSGPSGGAGGAGNRSPSGTAVTPAGDDDGAGPAGSAGGAALGGAALGGAAGAAAGYGGTGYPGADHSGADGPMGAAPQYPGSSRPTNHSGGGHAAGSGPAPGQHPQGGASPVGNPHGHIQAGPGSPLAGADRGRSGLVQPGDQGPWQVRGGPGGQIAQPGSQTMGPGGQPVGPGGQHVGPGGQPMGPGGQPMGPGVPGQPWAPMTYRRVRRGGWVLFALIVMSVAVMPLGPLVICIIALLWSILARTGTRLDRKVQRYRFDRGMESGGFGRALASAPGAVVASMLTSIASFILPAI